MNIQSITVGAFEVNCFVIWGNTKQALIIDPGYDANKIIKVVKENDLSISAYLLTHGHMDHINALADLYTIEPAPVAIHPLDLSWAFTDNQILPFYPLPKKPPEIARLLENNQSWTDGGLSYQVISTPGHTPGSVCFYFPEESALFSGDTLFASSIGRTDLRGGSTKEIMKSLATLAKLPDNTKIYPGHGPQSTMLKEKSDNYYMQDLATGQEP